jgi:hypothetical protein
MDHNSPFIEHYKLQVNSKKEKLEEIFKFAFNYSSKGKRVFIFLENMGISGLLK